MFVSKDWYTKYGKQEERNPFEVIKMTEEDFVSISNIKKEIAGYWKVNTEKEKVN